MLKKLLSLLLCLGLLAGAAFAEETVSALPALEDTAVVVTVNGKEITWADCEPYYESVLQNYGSYYDTSLDSTVELFRAAAVDTAVTNEVLLQKAMELGFGNPTEAEILAEYASADAVWESAVNNYIEYYFGTPSELSAETLATATEQAVAYWEGEGYSQESLRENYVNNIPYEKLINSLYADITVTDEEVEADYQAAVQSDKELYENDLAAYCDAVSMAQMYAIYGYDMGTPMYHPAGFRNVKHILLAVDDTLMGTYTDLEARYEEQQEALAGGEAIAEGEEPVTEDQVNEAKAAVIASCADKIDEINARLANGEAFDSLINEYTLDSDNVYEVCAQSSNYVPAFVEAAMSIEEVGGISAPYLSDYGVHIVEYVEDVPAGPVVETEEERQARYEELLETKQSEVYYTTVESWIAASEVVYSGAVTSMAEIEARDTIVTE